jgi:hypothetical protein
VSGSGALRAPPGRGCDGRSTHGGFTICAHRGVTSHSVVPLASRGGASGCFTSLDICRTLNKVSLSLSPSLSPPLSLSPSLSLQRVQRRSPAARPIYSDSESDEGEDAWSSGVHRMLNAKSLNEHSPGKMTLSPVKMQQRWQRERLREGAGGAGGRTPAIEGGRGGVTRWGCRTS